MIKKSIFLLLALTSILTACSDANVASDNTETSDNMQTLPTANSSNKVVLASEVNFTPLNPARGDQSPQAGTLWGDRSADVATGFLVKFKEGFSSPPHIHNVTYRGVVVKGLIHNDDADAAKMWMPPVSYWTQPAGEAHITAAKAEENMAFIEIQSGPYLVRPTEQAFDNGERPVNIDKSNLVWIDLPQKSGADSAAQIAYLWGNPQGSEPYATMLKIPTGFSGYIHTLGSTFRAVVIEGQPNYHTTGEKEPKVLEAGSYFSSEGQSAHKLTTQTESILYLRTDGKFEVVTE